MHKPLRILFPAKYQKKKEPSPNEILGGLLANILNGGDGLCYECYEWQEYDPDPFTTDPKKDPLILGKNGSFVVKLWAEELEKRDDQFETKIAKEMLQLFDEWGRESFARKKRTTVRKGKPLLNPYARGFKWVLASCSSICFSLEKDWIGDGCFNDASFLRFYQDFQKNPPIISYSESKNIFDNGARHSKANSQWTYALAYAILQLAQSGKAENSKAPKGEERDGQENAVGSLKDIIVCVHKDLMRENCGETSKAIELIRTTFPEVKESARRGPSQRDVVSPFKFKYEWELDQSGDQDSAALPHICVVPNDKKLIRELRKPGTKQGVGQIPKLVVVDSKATQVEFSESPEPPYLLSPAHPIVIFDCIWEQTLFCVYPMASMAGGFGG